MTTATAISTAIYIEKENLREVGFWKEDVLTDKVKIRLRDIYLKKAELLGNSYKGKVRLTFKSKAGMLYVVETTIWAANEEYISLKAGINIPTKSICDVEF
jgi:hypothetical protein